MTGLAPSRVEIQSRLEQALAERVPVAVATVVRGGQVGAKLLILPEETLGGLGDATLDVAIQGDATDLIARERSETRPYQVAGHDEPVEVFIETFPPPPTLLIFGAVHVAQPLSRFAKALGFDVIVSDARAKLATAERFPDADRIIQAWPDETLEQVEIRPNTYVAILSHDPKFDEPALVGTLSTPAAYIGAIGSRSTNEDRRRRLASAGMSPEQVARMRAPIGLDIGAATPEEMAISILGEIIALRRGRSGGSLTYATGRIRGERDAADGAKDQEDGDRSPAGRDRERVAAAR
jgi:xanthine dehydrogenase accessory factor